MAGLLRCWGRSLLKVSVGPSRSHLTETIFGSKFWVFDPTTIWIVSGGVSSDAFGSYAAALGSALGSGEQDFWVRFFEDLFVAHDF